MANLIFNWLFIDVTMSGKKSGMRYARLGDTGLWVSRLCLGAMTFGRSDKKWFDWMLSEEDSRAIIKRSLGMCLVHSLAHSPGTAVLTQRVMQNLYERDIFVVLTSENPFLQVQNLKLKIQLVISIRKTMSEISKLWSDKYYML